MSFKSTSSACHKAGVELKDYQLAVAYWLLQHPDQKGIIVDFGTGQGKTLVSVNIAEVMLRLNLVDYVIAVTPKSLLGNFEKAVRLCINNTNNIGIKLPSTYQIYSYDNFRLKKDDPMTHSHSQSQSQSSKRYMLIVDEAHNLRNASTKRAKAVIAAAQHAKFVVALTATPLVNGVSDIALLFRLFVPQNKWAMFPLDDARFENKWIGHEQAYVKQIKHLIAYYHNLPNTFPRVNEHVQHVDLSAEQVKAIESVKKHKLTLAERRMLQDFLDRDEMPTTSRLNAFMTAVRRLSNTIMDKNKKPICTPKISACVHQAIRGPKPVVIYSQFLQSGLEAVMHCLIHFKVPSKKIEILTGSLSATKRNEIVQRYNEGKVDYLLISSAGTEGISLKSTRQVHLLEPYWNMTRMEQVKGRGVRMDSHGHLPIFQRVVDVYYWLSKYAHKKSSKLNKSPDDYVWAVAQKKMEMINRFNKLHQQASIPLDAYSMKQSKEKVREELSHLLESEQAEVEQLLLSQPLSQSQSLSHIHSFVAKQNQLNINEILKQLRDIQAQLFALKQPHH